MSENTDQSLFISLRQDQKNKSTEIFEKLSKMIITGQLPPGYVFPNENEMCKNLGIGRSSVREAYAMLSHLGYIKRTKRGTFVNSLREIICAAPIGSAVEMASKEDYKAFRIMIEGETAKHAAINATDEEIDELEDILKKLDVTQEIDEVIECDIMFHVRIAELSRNKLLRNTIIAVSEAWKYSIVEGFVNLKENHPDLLAQVYNHHEDVFNAIKNRKPEEAKKKMIYHLDTAL